MGIDINTLTEQMLSAALPILKGEAPGAEPFARDEFTKLAGMMARTAAELEAGQINREDVSVLLNVQKQETVAALIARIGVTAPTALTVGSAVNAAYYAAIGAGGPAALIGPWPPR
jgi:hypothetical protein